MSIGVTGDYVVQAADTLALADNGFQFAPPNSGPDPTLTIKGKVTVSGSGAVTGIGFGPGLFSQSFILNDAGATFQVISSSGSAAYGVSSGGAAAAFVNRGLFQVSSLGAAYGVSTSSPGQVFQNSGVFQVSGRGATGVSEANGGSFFNTGAVEVSSGVSPGVGYSSGSDITSFVNNGLLRVSDATSALDSVAVRFDTSLRAVTFSNAGTIDADYAFRERSYFTPPTTNPVTLVNSGTIHGIIDFSAKSEVDTVSNQGSIVGDILLGGGDDVYDGAAGHLSGALHAGAGDDRLTGGGDDETFYGEGGNDLIDGGDGNDVAVYSGRASDYAIARTADGGLTLTDNRPGSPDGSDTLHNVERLLFSDAVWSTTALPTPVLDAAVVSAVKAVLRLDPQASSQAALASSLVGLAPSAAMSAIMATAASTTSVATLSYQIFTGHTPSAAGVDYLVSPTGPNPNNLNSAYYAQFSTTNRYINFASNLGKAGEGAAAFQAGYGALSLADAVAKAYTTIFGAAPSADKVSHLLHDAVPDGRGGSYEREAYFAAYGLDGLNGQGTKAAMVGWLLSQAAQADLGAYAKSNDAFLLDVATNNAPFGVDLVGKYAKPEYIFQG